MSVTCHGKTQKSTHCSKKTTNSCGFCHLHINQFSVPVKNVKVEKCASTKGFVSKSQVSVKKFSCKDCPVCFEKLSKCEKPLECGHWTCNKCLSKFSKAECPICRCKLKNVDVKILNEMKKNYRKRTEETIREETTHLMREERARVNVPRRVARVNENIVYITREMEDEDELVRLFARILLNERRGIHSIR